MNHVCLDTNVLVKLVLFEEDSAVAQSLCMRCLDRGLEIVAPVMCFFEILSAIRRKVYRGVLSHAAAAEACHMVSALPVSYVHHSSLAWRAFELATEYNQPTIYDALHLAVAEMYACDLWTADEALYRALSSRAPSVHLLSDFQA